MAREGISSVAFLETYAPMAAEGKSALEIGQALGREGEPEKVAQYVSIRASQLRTSLKEAAAVRAVELGLDEEATAALVAKVAAGVPKLKRSNGRGRKAEVIVNMLDSILAQADAEFENEDETEE